MAELWTLSKALTFQNEKIMYIAEPIEENNRRKYMRFSKDIQSVTMAYYA
ncbi:hypothetical protein MUTS2_00890 (plasmid) [Escherichia coli]|nr:hypothetical protein MUTS2_00890 [Escherichia coli]